MKLFSGAATLFIVLCPAVLGLPSSISDLEKGAKALASLKHGKIESSLSSMSSRELELELRIAKLNKLAANSESETHQAELDEVNEIWNKNHQKIPKTFKERKVSFS
jgi:hypothetical protein